MRNIHCGVPRVAVSSAVLLAAVIAPTIAAGAASGVVPENGVAPPAYPAWG